MSVIALGLNHKTAPVGLLEQVAVPADRLSKALTSLTQRDHVLEGAILSTCNRVEVYAHVTRYHGGKADVRDFFAEWGGIAPEDLVDFTYDYYDDRAAAHLFAVTSGLDSMVVGERQIQLQVKDALRDAQAEQACGRMIQALFRHALRVGRRVRTETAVGDGASSMVDVGLDAGRRLRGDLAGLTVLVVGAGKMGGMAAARVSEAGRILIANRTPEKAERLAAKVGGEVVALEHVSSALAAADLVLASTGSSVPLIDAEVVAAAMAGRADRPLVLVDLAVPRDIDPACGEVPGVRVLDIDAIRALTDTGRTGEEVARARALVEEEAARFAAWTAGVRIEPTIAALRARAEELRVAELARAAARLRDLDERQRAAVDQLTTAIVNRLLHEPSVRLKGLADTRGGEHYAAALRELFDLRD